MNDLYLYTIIVKAKGLWARVTTKTTKEILKLEQLNKS